MSDIRPFSRYRFIDREFLPRIPSSWLRFCWFMAVLGIATFSLIAGQAFASTYLTTLPHTSVDAGIWVYTWIASALTRLSVWIIGTRIRSRALLFLYKYFFQVVLFTFYRNLFARLQSPQQFIVIQLLSSIAVIFLHPFQVTRIWHRGLQVFLNYSKTYEEHVHAQAITFYVRGVAQNVTALSFLGWLCILHFGPNAHIYPFFRFSYNKDPYTFQLTFLATLAIWAIELVNSFIARQLMYVITNMDVTELGLNEMKEYPELTVASGKVSSNIE
ncbi:hypothetical protein QFC19_008606 [Naganishia cerealis]|uniref:Uncharacterized protein n=1 Tax=Naganishia cerealis TaxID=610337 RepID=A0ACC2V083_9TREE|nr:hypothetical protein QFC19_008606 [Naganishia cerealis]